MSIICASVSCIVLSTAVAATAFVVIYRAKTPIFSEKSLQAIIVFVIGIAYFLCQWSWHLLDSMPNRLDDGAPLPWLPWTLCWFSVCAVTALGFGMFVPAVFIERCRNETLSQPVALVLAAVFLAFTIISFVAFLDDRQRLEAVERRRATLLSQDSQDWDRHLLFNDVKIEK